MRGRTDAEGRFRLRMPKTRALGVTLMAAQYAPLRHGWGSNAAANTAWVPEDLGKVSLQPGLVAKGRVLDPDGRPIAGQGVVVRPLASHSGGSAWPSGFQQTTKSGADGVFELAPLKVGYYLVFAENHGQMAGYVPSVWDPRSMVPPIEPVIVDLNEEEPPDPLELHALPSVDMRIRIADSSGRPVRGATIGLRGEIPRRFANPKFRQWFRSAPWNRTFFSDAEGRAAFRAPKGLTQAQVLVRSNSTSSLDSGPTSFSARLKAGGPLIPLGTGLQFELGGPNAEALEGDLDEIEIVAYRAPTVLVTVKMADGGSVPEYARVNAKWNPTDDNPFGLPFIRQADGRYRSNSLVPNREYGVAVQANGYVTGQVARVNLPEGGTTELSLVIRKKPRALKVGDLAPPFAVETLAGDRLNLEDLRGKYVLLHFWEPSLRELTLEAQLLRSVYRRYGGDERFAMVGMCLSEDPKAAARALRDMGINWPQGILPDRYQDPIVLNYADWPARGMFLIGPDGKILERDLRDFRVMDAVRAILSTK